MGRVTISRAGSFYRVGVDPVDALPPSFVRPSTYTSHRGAFDTAHLLAEATGFPVVDQTQHKGASHG